VKSYGLEMEGPLILERVSTLPEWQSSFESRLVYQLSDGYVYYATSTGWVKLVGSEDVQSDAILRKYVSSIDATTTSTNNIYEVPLNNMFIINSFDVIVEDVFGAGDLPRISFGTTTDQNLFIFSERLKLDAQPYKRQYWDKPFGASLQGTIFTFSVTEAATYSNLVLSAVITGYLIPFTASGPSEAEPAYRVLYRDEYYIW
jgi:hypothetical protein